jgi:hypothetical protein
MTKSVLAMTNVSAAIVAACARAFSMPKEQVNPTVTIAPPTSRTQSNGCTPELTSKRRK